MKIVLFKLYGNYRPFKLHPTRNDLFLCQCECGSEPKMINKRTLFEKLESGGLTACAACIDKKKTGRRMLNKKDPVLSPERLKVLTSRTIFGTVDRGRA